LQNLSEEVRPEEAEEVRGIPAGEWVAKDTTWAEIETL
jgi:hypothetical protein